MLYKSNNNIYIFANNKYYKIEVVKDNLVPTKQVEYELKDKIKITNEDAMKELKKINKSDEFSEERSTRGIKLNSKRLY